MTFKAERQDNKDTLNIFKKMILILELAQQGLVKPILLLPLQ